MLYSGERLALTLRFLATGDNLHTLACGFRVGHSTAAEIVVNINEALYACLAKTHFVPPTTMQWKEKAAEKAAVLSDVEFSYLCWGY